MSKPIPIGYALANLPRYTSYPTAPHFGPLGEAEYRGWLAGIRPEDPLSLYLHIPYLRLALLVLRLPHHGDAERAAASPATARPCCRRPRCWRRRCRPMPGSPRCISAAARPARSAPPGCAALLAGLRATFGIRPDAELAIELDPRVLDEEIVAAMAEGGITRASFGVQDIEPAVQRRIGRLQPEAVVARGVGWLRAAGIQRASTST